MLLGVDIYVFTDHKNLMFDTLKMQCVLHWHTKIEEFSPMLHYIQAPYKILANNLSRLHHLVTLAQIAEGKKLVEPFLEVCCTSNDANQWPGGTGKMETETGFCFREKNGVHYLKTRKCLR
jgi:hypothetical protein